MDRLAFPTAASIAAAAVAVAQSELKSLIGFPGERRQRTRSRNRRGSRTAPGSDGENQLEATQRAIERDLDLDLDLVYSELAMKLVPQN